MSEKILFPRPVRLKRGDEFREYYSPDQKLACLVESDGKLFILSEWDGSEFAKREPVRNYPHNMLFAMLRYCLTLYESMCRIYKNKNNIPDWEPNVTEEEK